MTGAQIDLAQLRGLGATELLEFAFERFGNAAAIGTSLQKTGIVIIDLASRLGVPFRVFFVDTLLNHDETYQLLEEVEQRYGIEIERYAPSDEDVKMLHEAFGQHAHYFSRELCCRVRKTIPLQKALATVDAWISGLRVDQSIHREENAEKASMVATEQGRTILKINPLLDWSEQHVDEYVAEHRLPYNKLYDYVSTYGERFTVIGCKPCHVPIKDQLDNRMGKFPWEQGKKECGMHEDQGSGI